ncbi:hypothetical protein PVAP13_9KG308202 [Panicum virgatum]|uniref:Uncharacterized protein n=1 Tax=Panicum virgatum TaxID=38727 RepID=A0A8T0NET5_PANVG|nr:hypothetical protein PVAP13_9KG308202 [Panicum virgatum]
MLDCTWSSAAAAARQVRSIHRRRIRLCRARPTADPPPTATAAHERGCRQLHTELRRARRLRPQHPPPADQPGPRTSHSGSATCGRRRPRMGSPSTGHRQVRRGREAPGRRGQPKARGGAELEARGEGQRPAGSRGGGGDVEEEEGKRKREKERGLRYDFGPPAETASYVQFPTLQIGQAARDPHQGHILRPAPDRARAADAGVPLSPAETCRLARPMADGQAGRGRGQSAAAAPSRAFSHGPYGLARQAISWLPPSSFPRPAQLRGQRVRSDVSSLRPPLAGSPGRRRQPPTTQRGVATIIGSSHRGQPRRQGRGTERAKPLSSAASLQYQMWNLLGNSGRKREDLGIVPAIQMDTCNMQGNGVQNFSVHGQATVVVQTKAPSYMY